VRRDEQRLQDILEAIEKIDRFAGEGRAAFDVDERTQVWIVHHIQIVGEAARALSEDLRMKNPQVPWPLIVGMRHILVHDYFGIDLGEVWSVVERDLPVLRREVQAILDSERTEGHE
jgi:uncharacterized protein with HEPN domain